METKRELKEKLEIAEEILNSDKRTSATYAVRKELRQANKTIVLLIAMFFALVLLLLLPKKQERETEKTKEPSKTELQHPSLK